MICTLNSNSARQCKSGNVMAWSEHKQTASAFARNDVEIKLQDATALATCHVPSTHTHTHHSNVGVTQIQCVCNLCGIAGQANHANKHHTHQSSNWPIRAHSWQLAQKPLHTYRRQLQNGSFLLPLPVAVARCQIPLQLPFGIQQTLSEHCVATGY